MRARLLTMLIVLAAVAVAQNIAYKPDPDWQPPATIVTRPNPLAGKPELAAGGRKLFLRHCAECHGEDGRGLKNAADLQLPVVQEQTDGALQWKINHGNARRGMPSFSSLPELQRWQIVLHLRTLKKDTLQPPAIQ
jgi:mono/diheme cytochrome c family protein